MLDEITFSSLPTIIGHRGAAGSAPENTLASIRKAAELGAQWVELDVATTADGIPVIFHDRDIKRCTGESGLILQTNYHSLTQLDAGKWFSADFIGEKIPTLADTIDLLLDLKLGFNLEIKPTIGWEIPTAEAAMTVLRAKWPKNHPLLISSFNIECLQVAEKLFPDAPRGLLTEAIPRNWKDRMSAANCQSLHCFHSYVTQDICDAIRESGKYLLSYTVNTRLQAKQLFEMGVHSVFTDFPERLIEQSNESRKGPFF